VSDTHVTITGNLTADPELRFTNNGAAVANFRIAVTTRVRDGNTWRDGDTSYFRVNAWRQLARHVTDSLAKGDRAVVIGRLRSRSWEAPGGEQRSVIEIEADEVAPSLKWAVAKPQRVSRNGEAEAKPSGEFADEPAF
jgi:single-strand DNA-binding protein